jgi:hypothetical protein
MLQKTTWETFTRSTQERKSDDSWYIQYKVKDENELRYQVLSSMNEDRLKRYIDTYLVQEQGMLNGSYFFFDALPADIESIRVIENTRYNCFNVNYETPDSKAGFNM